MPSPDENRAQLSVELFFAAPNNPAKMIQGIFGVHADHEVGRLANGAWVDMIEAAQAMDVDVYVPGHGFVDHPSILDEELEIFQGAIRTVIAEARRLHEEGYSVTDAQAQALFGDLEQWSLRSSQGDRAIQQVYAELDGSLPEANR